MQVVEIYKASDSVEAQLLCQALEDEVIHCEIVGEHVESLYGFAHAWNRPGIVVSNDDERRAREIVASRVGSPSEEPTPSLKLQYGLGRCW